MPATLALCAHRLNGDKTVAVSTNYFWNNDLAACPRGVKVQLLVCQGVAVYGQYAGEIGTYEAWAPLPRRAPTA